MEPSPRRSAVHPALAELRTWKSPSALLGTEASLAGQGQQGIHFVPSPPQMGRKQKGNHPHFSSPRGFVSPAEEGGGEFTGITSASPRQARQMFMSSSATGVPKAAQKESLPYIDMDSARGPYGRPKAASEGLSFQDNARVPPLNLSSLGGPKYSPSNASPRIDSSQQMGAAVPVLSTMSLTDMGVDVGMLQKNGVPDQSLVRIHQLIVTHSSGFHSGVRSILSTLPEAIRSETLHAVWSAFFSAWSTELNAQCGGEIMGMADERHRLTEELTARRHEAMQMRDGIQRLMRDQVDRMLQERHDAKERDMLRSKLIKERATLRSTALDLQSVSKERDNLSMCLADSKIALDRMTSQYTDAKTELERMQKVHRDASSEATAFKLSLSERERALQQEVSKLRAELENQEARAAEAQERALAAIAKTSSNSMPNNEHESMQAKIVEQARLNAILRGHVENLKEEVKSLSASKKAADDSNRSVLDLRAELARTQAAHNREKEDVLAKVTELQASNDEQRQRIKELEEKVKELMDEIAENNRKHDLKVEHITRIAAEEASNLRQELTAAAQLNESTRATMAVELEKSLSRMNENETMQQEERKRWANTLQEAKEKAGKEIDSLKQQHKVELAEQSSVSSGQVSNLQSKVDGLSARNSQLTRDLAEIKGTLSEALREKVEVAGKLQSAVDKNEYLQDRVQTTEAKLKETEALLSASEKSWADTYEQLQTETQARKAAEATTKSNMEKITLESAGDRARIVQLEAKLRTQHEDNDRMATNLHAAQSKLATIGPELEELRRKYSAAEREIEARNQRVSFAEEEVSRKVESLKAADKELSDLRDYLKSREQVLKETFDLAGNTGYKLQDAHAQIERLIEERKVLQQELEASKEETTAAESSITSLKGELSALSSELAQQAALAADQRELVDRKAETEGRLRLDLQKELARCCQEVLEVVASEAEASVSRGEALLPDIAVGASAEEMQTDSEAKIMDAARSFHIHVQDQLSKLPFATLRAGYDAEERRGVDETNSAGTGPSSEWGDVAAAETSRKAAYKLVFNTTKSVKGLLSRLHAEAELLRIACDRRNGDRMKASMSLGEQVALLSFQAVQATADGHAFPAFQATQELETDEETKSNVAAKIDQCVQAITHMRAELLQQAHAARKTAQEANDAVKAYKLKLGAAKSVVSLTKGNLDDTTTKIGMLRGQLSQAQTEVENLEQRNTELSEEVKALKTELANEIRMKEDIQARTLTQGEDISLRQREISQLQARITLLEEQAKTRRGQNQQRLQSMLSSLKKSQGMLDTMRQGNLHLRAAVAEEMKNSEMHLRQDVDQLQKALQHAYEQEGDSRDRLRECQSMLTARNNDLDIVATGLGELLNTAELMVVQKDFRNIDARKQIERNMAEILDIMPRVVLHNVIWRVVETFEKETCVSEDQQYMLQEQLSKYVQGVQANVAKLANAGEGASSELKVAELQLQRLLAVQPDVEQTGLDLLRSLAAYNSRLAALSERLSSAKTRKEDCLSKKSTVEMELANSEHADLGAAQQELGAVTQELEAVEKELNDLTDEHTACAMELKGYVETSQAEGMRMRQESDSLVQQSIDLEAAIAERTSAVAQRDASRTTLGMMKQLEAMIEAIMSIMETSEEARQELRRDLLEARKQNEELCNANTTYGREIARLKQENTATMQSNAELQAENRRLADQVGPKEGAVSGKDVEALHAKVYQLESEVSSLGGDKKGLQQLLENVSNELDDKKEEAAMLRRSLASMESTTVHLHQLLRESQGQTPEFLNAAQRRSVLGVWLAALPDNVRVWTQDVEKSRQSAGVVELDHASLMQLAGEVYLSKIVEDQICVGQDRPRQRLFQQLYNFVFFKFGARYVSELVLEGVVHSLDRLAQGTEGDGHLALFRSLLGLDPDRQLSAVAESFFLRFLSAVLEAAGTELTDLPKAIQRCSEPDITIKAAVRATEACFLASQADLERMEEAYSRSMAAEVQAMSDYDLRFRKPSELASEIEMKLFEVSSSRGGQNLSLQAILECGLHLFCEEEAREQRRLQSLLEAAADARDVPGTVAYEAFAKVAEQLSGELDRGQLQQMYREALLHAKPGASMPDIKHFSCTLIRHGCSAIQDQSSAATYVDSPEIVRDALESGQGRRLLQQTWKSCEPKIKGIIRMLTSKLETLAPEIPRLEADQLERELQQIKQAVVGLSMLESSEEEEGAVVWGVFRELLARLQTLHTRLPWSAKEKAQLTTGVSAFASLFGSDLLHSSLMLASAGSEHGNEE